MFRMFLVPALLATLLTVLPSAHTSSTTATAGGTAAHTSSTAATGAYGGTYQASSARVYSPTTYQGYSAAGHYGTVSTTGVVRYP